MTNIENRQHIIIEGCYLPPGQIRNFEPEYLEQIIPFYIGFSKQYIGKHYSRIIERLSEIERKEYNDYMSRDNLIMMNAGLKQRYAGSGATFFEIDDNYEQEMNEVYAWVDGQVRAKRALR